MSIIVTVAVSLVMVTTGSVVESVTVKVSSSSSERLSSFTVTVKHVSSDPLSSSTERDTSGT